MIKFKEGAIKPGMIIHCPMKEDAKVLLRYLDSMSYTWNYAHKKIQPEEYSGWTGKNTLYFITDKEISWGVTDSTNKDDCKITEFSDLLETGLEFKPGDKVRIRRGLGRKHYDGNVWLNSDMAKLGGQVFTVESYRLDGVGYFLKEDEEKWTWTDEMLEPANKIPVNEMCINMPVGTLKVYNTGNSNYPGVEIMVVDENGEETTLCKTGYDTASCVFTTEIYQDKKPNDPTPTDIIEYDWTNALGRKPFPVTIKETLCRDVVIYARNKKDACERAEDFCNTGEIELVGRDFAERECEAYDAVSEEIAAGYEIYGKGNNEGGC